MIDGSVSHDGVPLINLSILGDKIDAIIDTGFNGDLELPNYLREQLRSRFVGSVISSLAGGKVLKSLFI